MWNGKNKSIPGISYLTILNKWIHGIEGHIWSLNSCDPTEKVRVGLYRMIYKIHNQTKKEHRERGLNKNEIHIQSCYFKQLMSGICYRQFKVLELPYYSYQSIYQRQRL